MSFFAPGIPDEAFVRGEAPMTREEVRAIVMAKARLRPDARVLDIGAGTGTFTIEAAQLCPRGMVIAVERDAATVAVLRENIARFALPNAVVYEGEAPEILADMTPVDRVLLGGVGNRMADTLEALPVYLNPGGRVVSQTVTLEATMQVYERFQQPPWTAHEILQLNIARGVSHARFAGFTRLEAIPPSWVVIGQIS